MPKKLMEKLDETHLSSPADGEVPEGLRVEELAGHRDVCVYGGEPLLRGPGIRQLVALAASVPGLVLVIHHAEQVRTNLMIADALDHVAGYRAIGNVDHILLVRRGFHNICCAKHALDDAYLDLVLDAQLLQILSDDFLQGLRGNLLITVEALHEGLGATMFAVHTLKNAASLREELEADGTVRLELLGDVPIAEGIGELWRLFVTTREELLPRLVEVRRPQAKQ
mmetsp:Transcript_63136/g.137241  ORF Transcript_63136/g.137241 Transcript_63136/m.137241 type:complete len:225 (+) Transcript_63136:1649-2323(+)